ncbi:MAG: WHG domain-containing protein [Chloroflexi bacterium]|nr:WHG domain-containing protein [Chloroflexota bacterium]
MLDGSKMSQPGGDTIRDATQMDTQIEASELKEPCACALARGGFGVDGPVGLDELVATGAMPTERRAGAELVAWSAVHGFAVLRASGAFGASGEMDPDSELLLDAVARSLDVQLMRANDRRPD